MTHHVCSSGIIPPVQSFRARCVSQSWLAFVLVLAPSVTAQTPPSWNRRVTGLAITTAAGGPAGTYDATAVWRIDLEGSSTSPVELGTVVDLSIAGGSPTTMTAEECLIWELDAGGAFDCTGQPNGTACGTVTISGVSGQQLSCDADTGTCATPPFTASFSNIALSVDDEVTIALTAASGAERDTQTDDDSGALVFASWNRRIRSVQLQASPGGPDGIFEISIEWVIDFSASATLSLNLALEPHATGCPDADPLCAEPDPGTCCQEACNCKGGCTVDDIKGLMRPGLCGVSPDEPCGEAIIDDAPVELTCDPETNTCSTPPFFAMITTVSAPQSNRMLVTLIPAPGALPELFTEDDRWIVEFSTSIPAVSHWGLIVISVLLLATGTLVMRRRSGRA